MKFLFLALGFLVACQTGTKPAVNVSYEALLKKYTRSHKQYEGAYNVFEAYATLLNSPVQHAVWQKQKNQLNWSLEVADKKRTQSVEDMLHSTQFMLSFYTPKMELNRLDKKQSIYKLQLRVGEQIYAGTLRREFVPLVNLQELFLHPTAWHKIYKVSFEVPTQDVEQQGAVLIVRSLKVVKELSFPPTPAM